MSEPRRTREFDIIKVIEEGEWQPFRLEICVASFRATSAREALLDFANRVHIHHNHCVTDKNHLYTTVGEYIARRVN